MYFSFIYIKYDYKLAGHSIVDHIKILCHCESVLISALRGPPHGASSGGCCVRESSF